MDCGLIGPIVSLLIDWPAYVDLSGAGECVSWWVLPLAHAVYVIFSCGDGFRKVSAGNVPCLALLCSIEGGEWLIVMCQDAREFVLASCVTFSLVAAVIVAFMLVVFCLGIWNFCFVVYSGGVVVIVFGCGLLLDHVGMYYGVLFWIVVFV